MRRSTNTKVLWTCATLASSSTSKSMEKRHRRQVDKVWLLGLALQFQTYKQVLIDQRTAIFLVLSQNITIKNSIAWWANQSQESLEKTPIIVVIKIGSLSLASCLPSRLAWYASRTKRTSSASFWCWLSKIRIPKKPKNLMTWKDCIIKITLAESLVKIDYYRIQDDLTINWLNSSIRVANVSQSKISWDRRPSSHAWTPTMNLQKPGSSKWRSRRPSTSSKFARWQWRAMSQTCSKYGTWSTRIICYCYIRHQFQTNYSRESIWFSMTTTQSKVHQGCLNHRETSPESYLRQSWRKENCNTCELMPTISRMGSS